MRGVPIPWYIKNKKMSQMEITTEEVQRAYDKLEELIPRRTLPACIHVDRQTYMALLLAFGVAVDSQRLHNYNGIPVYPHDDWTHPRMEVQNLDGQVIYEQH